MNLVWSGSVAVMHAVSVELKDALLCSVSQIFVFNLHTPLFFVSFFLIKHFSFSLDFICIGLL